ncbi:MAG: glycosyltransferase family 4 protein, partial [Gemmatimonadetes bacterium]|nr:glycosyltransferase family 4 protein [Gemmatimonadota bacterium]
PPAAWARLIHRRFYYALISGLEGRVYSRKRLRAAAPSGKVRDEIQRHFPGGAVVRLVRNAVDGAAFQPELRERRRLEAREALGIGPEELVLLLIGNGWMNKGVPCLLRAASLLPDVPLKVMIVGRDDRAPFRRLLAALELSGRVLFLDPSPDVLRFYAAADVYVGPSVYDAAAFPPLEAMACGLPVITSLGNGGSELITHEVDGLVLSDPTDSAALAALVRRLYRDPGLRSRLGRAGWETARRYDWDTNAAEMRALFEAVLVECST